MNDQNSVDGITRTPGVSIPENPIPAPVPGSAASYERLFSNLAIPARKPAAPFVSDKKDAVFSLLFFVLGYAFIRWYFFYERLPSCFLFTVLYAAVILAYAAVRGQRPARESWFWLCIMFCLGGPAFLFPELYDGGLLGQDMQFYLLMLVAAYWTLCLPGSLSEQGRTSNWIVLDVANALCLVPFGNFFCQPRVLARGMRGTVTGRRLLYVLIGLCLALPLLGLVLPSLFAADIRFSDWFNSLYRRIFPYGFLFFFVLSLPVSLFLFGLCFGSFSRRHTEVIQRKHVSILGTKLRFLPNLAVTTALGVMCAVYLLFILFQSGYLFSAFLGRLPESFTFAEYAREGFFELCRVCSLNAAFLLAANLLSKTPRTENRVLRTMNLLLSSLTLLLIATAGSKIGLYISAYGLTPLRVLVSCFLLWLAFVFVLVLVWQYKPIPLLRLSVFAGAVLVALMYLLPVLSGIEHYNLARFGEADPSVSISCSELPY